MKRKTTEHRDDVPDDIRPFIPLEAALTGTAMVVGTLLVPASSGQADQHNDAMILAFAGFLLFIVAKISLVSRGYLSTWGPTPMRPPFKLSYITGYLLMAVGCIGMLS